jgi:CRP/FNR family transcriptional regulator, cyclic AMP receptor protein
VKNLNFFPQVPEPALMNLASRSEMEVVERGHQLYVGSINSDDAYLVKEGNMRLLRSMAEGRHLGIDILGPGDILGMTTVLTNDMDSDFAEAIDKTVLCKVSAQVLRELLEEHSHVSLHFSKIAGLRRRRMDMRLGDIAFTSVRTRLLRLLADLVTRFGKQTADGTEIRLRLTQQDFAEMIGANREATNRALLKLVDEGIISFAGKYVVVHEPETIRSDSEKIVS